MTSTQYAVLTLSLFLAAFAGLKAYRGELMTLLRRFNAWTNRLSIPNALVLGGALVVLVSWGLS